MAITPIEVVIDPPLPTDAPSIFDQKAFSAWAAINSWATQANALAVQVNEDVQAVNDPSIQAVANNIAAIVAVDGNKTNINAVNANKTNIDAVKNNTTNINTVAGISGNVTTVAGISANVTTVATNNANVTAVAGNATNINAVNANKANIDAVAGNATNINAVNANKTNIDAVKNNATNINTVAGISANVTTVATNSANVTAVAGNATNINAVNDNKANIDAVAGNATNINAVNANKANIDTVAAIDADVSTVAGIAANVTTVVAIGDEVTAVAGNATNINAVNANKANIDAVAGNATNINAVNANKTNIDAVKNNATNINAVAGNKANIDTVAGKATDVTTVASNSANVTTVATNITAVNAAATNMAAIQAAPGAASTASSAASTATTKAGEASDSALAAAGSASIASTKAGEASGYADRAEQAVDDADNIFQQVQAYGNGWTPVLAMASDGERRVVQVTDWTGGQGTKPATGYLGPTGIVANIASAVNVRGATGSGAVSSVGMSAPTGFSVSDSPVTSSGTLVLSFAAGYSLPTTAKQGQWDQAYGWGDHASAGYALSSSLGTAAAKNAPSSGNATSTQVVLGNDTRLTDARTPTSHTHTAAQVTGLATVATTGSYNDLLNKPTIPPGTVTSVGMTVPTGLSVSGSPITGSGTLAMTFAAGYSLPTTAKQGQWDQAYGWGDHASAGYAPTASPTFTGTATLPATQGNDSQLSRMMLKDCGVAFHNAGNTYDINYINGAHQRWVPTSNGTLAITNWPPTGNLGELLLEGLQLGLRTITWPSIRWVLNDGTTSTNFNDTEVELQTSSGAIDWILLWSRDGGATIYGKVMR